MLNESVVLEPDQEELLIRLVEITRRVPREKKDLFLFVNSFGGGSLIHSGLPGEEFPAFEGDLDTLADAGLLRLAYGSRGSPRYDVTPRGYAHYRQFRERIRQPVERVEGEMRMYIDAEQFASRHQAAHAKWIGAERALWAADASTQLTRIGHDCRETMQLFVSDLVAQFSPPDAHADPQRVVQRFKSVLALRRERLGETERKFLDAQLVYWGELLDLIQRQEHGGQREGDPVIWEDARRVVFQTLVTMYEIDRSMQRVS